MDMEFEWLVKTLDNKVVIVDAEQTDIDNWGKENKIELAFLGKLYNKDVWYIEDDQQLMLFKMRWA